MKVKKKSKIVFRSITVIMALILVSSAVYVMVNGLGLVEGYDFGVGAYYYVDIPDFEKVIPDDAFNTDVPLWIHLVIFASWGLLMWRLWIWIDKKVK